MIQKKIVTKDNSWNQPFLLHYVELGKIAKSLARDDHHRLHWSYHVSLWFLWSIYYAEGWLMSIHQKLSSGLIWNFQLCGTRKWIEMCLFTSGLTPWCLYKGHKKVKKINQWSLNCTLVWTCVLRRKCHKRVETSKHFLYFKSMKLEPISKIGSWNQVESSWPCYYSFFSAIVSIFICI